ncbi:MAG: alkaline phosphatase D family protein [Sinimarinibacterium sp.]|jgi:hypothetical protein
MKPNITRRELLQMAAAGGGGLLIGSLAGCGSSAPADAHSGSRRLRFDFAALPDGDGWSDDWTCVGVATLSRAGGQGLLLAGSDIFPNDPRPIAFALDARFVDGAIRAVVTRVGRCVGAVLRRTSTRAWYAALYDTDAHTLSIVRRTGSDLVTLAQTVVAPTAAPAGSQGVPATLEFTATGRFPSQLSARLTGADGLLYETSARDDTSELQSAGDAGVLTQADTLLPGSNPVLPALGNLHLLPYAVQEGEAVIATPVGQAFIDTIRQRSTAAFAQIEISPAQAVEPAAASAIAATTGTPLPGGATLHVASDLPAEVFIELADTPQFVNARVVAAGPTDAAFLATTTRVDGLPPGQAFWRPRLVRGTLETVGPTRQFHVLPPTGDPSPLSFVYGSCGSQFNAIFDHLAARAPDLFIWQGDLNYPDTHGPFAQNMAGYAGIWRHFLDNPRMAPILERASFVAGRDDHDYGLQDANAASLVPWGIEPWNALINPQTYQLLSFGLVDIWVLDQRMFKSDPTLADAPDKTLLGAEQRQWLMDGLAASRAPFHVVCSPCTLAPAPGANARDGSWASGFTAERDLILQHIAAYVGGQTVFLTGDTHFTMVWDRDGLFEQRACPLDIPTPNDQNISNPLLELDFGSTPGVTYWSRRSHFSLLRVGAEGNSAVLTIDLVRDDGETVQSTRFERPIEEMR